MYNLLCILILLQHNYPLIEVITSNVTSSLYIYVSKIRLIAIISIDKTNLTSEVGLFLAAVDLIFEPRVYNYFDRAYRFRISAPLSTVTEFKSWVKHSFQYLASFHKPLAKVLQIHNALTIQNNLHNNWVSLISTE